MWHLARRLALLFGRFYMSINYCKKFLENDLSLMNCLQIAGPCFVVCKKCSNNKINSKVGVGAFRTRYLNSQASYCITHW